MKIIPKPQKSEIILLAFFITFLIIVSLFFIYLNNKCRGINSFAFDQIKKDKLYAVLAVECGEIVIEIFDDLSPVNSERFLKFIRSKAYVDY